MVGSINAARERGKKPGRSALVVGRLLANGRPDPSFGEGGWIFTRLAPGAELEGVGAALDPSGRLLVAGITHASHEAPAGYVLARYLPEPLSDEELATLVAQAITETGASSPRQMGVVMTALRAETTGRADGKRVSDAVRRALSGGA